MLTEETIEAVYDMKVKLMECDGIPVIIPYPKDKNERRN